MATIKKVKKDEVKVEVTPEVTETPVVEGEKEPETPVVENEGEKEPEVQVDQTPVDDTKMATEKNVRVKVRKDIRFNFGSEVYDLTAGQCINVPVAVKMHLNRQDALLPL